MRVALLLPAALASLVLCTNAAAAGAPILGSWQFDGAVIKVTGGGGSYEGVVVSGSYGGCAQVVKPGYVSWKGLKGSGFSYSGKFSWYWTDDCSPAGTGPLTITLSSADAGVVKSTGPDGSSFSTAITRTGKAPAGEDKPKTHCKRAGKQVLCAEQRRYVNKLTKVAKQEAQAGKQLAKAKKTWQEEGTKAAEDTLMYLAGRVGEIFLLAEGKKQQPTPQLPKPKLEYKELKLPPTEQLERVPIPGNSGKLFKLVVEGQQTMTLNDKLMRKVETRRADDPAFASELNTAALGYCGGFYDSCTPAQKLVVANQAKGFAGEQFEFSNQAADLGVAGARFTFTLPGFK
jgi:hypothetical protein